MLLHKKLGKFFCWIGLHKWAGWFVYGHKDRYRKNCCKRPGCDAWKEQKMHWQTGSGGWSDTPTPLGRWVE